MPRGRKLGTKLSQEQKDKMLEGRILRKAKKLEKEEIARSTKKPALIISKKFKTGFDFWPEIRNVLRPLHKYLLCKDIEKAIVKKSLWNNREKVLKILEKYFILQTKSGKIMYNIDKE